MMLNNCSTIENTVGSNSFQKILQSPQYKNGKFAGVTEALTMAPSDWAKSSWQFLFGRKALTPNQPLPVQSVDLSLFNSNHGDQLNSTWIGHSSLLINISGYKILTDPVFEKKVSIIGPTRFNGDVPLNPDQLPQIDLVIISHNHYDHLNKASLLQIQSKVKQFLTPLAVGKRLIDWGIPSRKIVEMDWWDSFQFDDNLKITATPAQHFSGRGLLDRNKTLWASWVITTDQFNIFYSGDSGYFNGFKKIGERFGPFDMTFLECGAYDKLWHGVHMFPEETVQAHIDLKGNLLHPIHWGTFNLALHTWSEPMIRVAKATRDNNVTIATPIVGQTISFGSNPYGRHWWNSVLEN